jgi:hypothetical protein
VRIVRLTVLTVMAVLAATGSARGQVVIDPDSPSAKEYAIPLEDERRQADPAQAPDAGINQGERASPLFGEGIEPRAENGPDTSGKGGESKPQGGGGQDKAEEPGTPSSERTPEIVRAAAADPGAPDGGLGTPAVIGGVALAVLLVGGLAGLLVRRQHRSSSSP